MNPDGWKDRELDVVVFGATGFVGQLVAEYLATFAPSGVTIGLAGRSLAKLQKVRDGLPAGAHEWPLIVADSNNSAELKAMALRARVIATTVGPYAKYGLPLVEACANVGTHYVDLTGEVLFVRRCADQFDAAAKASGARIVNSCGFDSIPSDLGVFLAYQQATADGAGTLTDTTLVVKSMKGGFSGGTIDSMRTQVDEIKADRSLRKLLADPYSLSPDRSAVSAAKQPKDTVVVEKSTELGGWIGPFVMASYNTRIVRRSDALLDWAYGPSFRYREVSFFGNGPTAPAKAAAMATGLGFALVGMGTPGLRTMLDRALPDPGEGPSEAARKAGRFQIEVNAKTTSGATYVSTIAAAGDPGYAATSVMISEAALCLALEADDLPDRAGVLTPATAMGDQLAERLRRADFTVEVKRN